MQLSLIFPTTELQGTFPANAEKLFKVLNVNSKFADWIKNRITQYDFIENQDYIVQVINTNKGRPCKDYFITLDMAKELCMLERNEKGKEARRYFIKCENELNTLKLTQYQKQIQDKNAENRALRHKYERLDKAYKDQCGRLVKTSEVSFFRKRKSKCYDEKISLVIYHMQKDLEIIFRKLGAINAYLNGDSYFLENLETLLKN